MNVLALVAERPLVWGLFLVYLAGTSWLAWLGHRRTADIRSYALGSGTMHPAIVGVTLAASIASTATFVINPGFVYVHGVSALMHLGVAAGIGIVTGLVTMSVRFRREGARSGALTLPQWIGARYRSKGLTVLFAGVNLLSLFFVVLIVGGISIVMQQTLGLSNTAALVLIIGFVFGYVFVGGTWAHAYTNTLQGVIMVGVSAIIVASGLPLLRGGAGVRETLAAQDPNLLLAINPASPLFNGMFSVWIAGLVVGFALVCQPHVMTKALYVKSDRDVRRYLAVTIGVSLVFTALLLVGLYARLMQLPPEAFVDPATGAFRQDLVMAVYLTQTFGAEGTFGALGPVLLAFITVAILAAGMSTLDGILVALSSIAGNDLVRPLAGRWLLAGRAEAEQARVIHRASQVVLVAMGLVAFVVALRPPELLGIFGQIGVYGIVAASTLPILLGVFVRQVPASAVWASALTGLALHFALHLLGRWAMAAETPGTRLFLGVDPILAGWLNPAVTATVGILASAAVGIGITVIAPRLKRAADADPMVAPAAEGAGERPAQNRQATCTPG